MKIFVLYILFFAYSIASAGQFDILWYDKGIENESKTTAFSPDGKYLYLAVSKRIANNLHNEIQVRDALSGNLVDTIPTGFITEIIDIDEQGNRIFLAGKCIGDSESDEHICVEIIDLNDNSVSLVYTFPDYSSKLNSIAELSVIDGTNEIAFWVKDNQEIFILNYLSKELHELSGRLPNISNVSFSPDGFLSAIVSDNKIDIVDLMSREYIRTITFDYEIFDSAISPENKKIALFMQSSYGENIIRCISLETWKETGSWETSLSDSQVMFSGDGDKIIVSPSMTGLTQVINTDGGSRFSFSHKIKDNSLSADKSNNLLAACDSDNHLIMLDLKLEMTKYIVDIFEPSTSHSSAAAVCITTNETVLTGGSKGWINLRNINNGSLIKRIKAHSSNISSISVDSIGLIAASCSNDDSVKVWNAFDLALIDSYTAECGIAECVAVSPNGNIIATAGSENGIHIYDINSNDKYRIDNDWSDIKHLDFSNDSDYLLAGSSDKWVKIFKKSETGRFVLAQEYLTDTTENRFYSMIKTVKFFNSGKYFVTGGTDHKAKLWSYQPIHFIKEFVDSTGWKSTINDVCLSPNDSMIYTSDEYGFIKVYEIKSGRLLESFDDIAENNESAITDLSISDDGLFITSSVSDGSIYMLSPSVFTNVSKKDNYFSNLDIYPNPSDNWINLKFVTKSDQEVSILIFNSIGEKVRYIEKRTTATNNIRINIEDLPIGVYELRISGIRFSLGGRFIKY